MTELCGPSSCIDIYPNIKPFKLPVICHIAVEKIFVVSLQVASQYASKEVYPYRDGIFPSVFR